MTKYSNRVFSKSPLNTKSKSFFYTSVIIYIEFTKLCLIRNTGRRLYTLPKSSSIWTVNRSSLSWIQWSIRKRFLTVTKLRILNYMQCETLILKNHHHYHHHHMLTVYSRHPSLSAITLGSSTTEHLVFAQSWLNFCWPANTGASMCGSSKEDVIYVFFLISPLVFSIFPCLIWMLCEMGRKWLYNKWFGGNSF